MDEWLVLATWKSGTFVCPWLFDCNVWDRLWLSISLMMILCNRTLYCTRKNERFKKKRKHICDDCWVCLSFQMYWFLKGWFSTNYDFTGENPIDIVHLSLTLLSSKLILCQRTFRRSISLTSLCVGVPELCLGILKQRRYWKQLYCRSSLKMMPCVKISDAETHEEVDGKRLLGSQRRKMQGSYCHVSDLTLTWSTVWV